MSRPDGRTSDLIRRFESLALEKGGGGVAARPPPGVRRASVAAPSEAERAPAATLAAAQSALSAAIAHAKPPAPAVPPVVTRPRRPSASEASKAQSQAALGSPRPQAASPVVATHKGDARQGRGKRLLTQLNERAALDPLLQVSNNSWLQFADKCIDEGRLCQQNNDPETAYLRFMTACNIYTKKFGNLRDGNPIARDPAYLRLRTAVATHLVDDLEKLHALLEHRTVDEPEPAAAARQAGSPSLTAEQLDQMESRFSLLYPKNPHDILQPAPRADSAAMTAAAQAQQAGEEQSRFDAIDAQVRSIDAGVQGLRSREGALAGAATVGQSHASNRISSAVSPLPPPQPAATAASSSGSASANGGGSPASGTQTWSVDPSATTCTARELRGLIDRSRTGINERPKILVLDVRAYQDHVWGHIDHRYVVSIDPAGLRAKCTSADIASSLALLPDDQQRWFRKRNEFDIVVYVSQKMRSFSDADSPERPALEHLNSAIYHCEYEKPLRRPPLFLVGGFDAWVQEAGAQRCRWSEASRRPAAPSYPLPLAPAALDRASAVAAAGSAGANGYHQAPREEDRHRPVRTSATHGYGVPTGPPAAAAAPAYTPAQALAAPPAAGTPTRTMFDNPTYGFTGPAYAARGAVGYPAVEPPRAVAAVGYTAGTPPPDSAAAAERRVKRRAPPPVPQPLVPPKPPAYAPPTATPPHRPQALAVPMMQYQQYQPAVAAAPAFYSHPVAAGSDPSLNGRMHAGANLRNAAAFGQAAVGAAPAAAAPAAAVTSPLPPPQSSRRTSQLSDTAAYGATGLKNFGNTCFMNSVIQCLIGTGPLTRYFMRGEWKRSAHRDDKRARDVTVELVRLFENMWRGQYGSISPVGFRAAVGSCSEQFKGNDQEDAHDFASFLLDTLHETLNQVHPRPPADRALTADEERQIERLPDDQQAMLWWKRAVRRDWSIVTSIFQGQIQSRLTCLTCKHTSTTYHTFTGLSVPIPKPPAGGSSTNGAVLTRKGQPGPPVNIYQCLDAYSETEVLDGDNMWQCPHCRAKRKATKRLLIARLPLVLVVHLKRFSTIGHFREKLETNVLVPTKKLYMQNYALPAAQHASVYNLYAVANHFGTLSSGHYTASVYNGLRDQWNYFDDTRVSPIPETQVATPAAYLLFFVQAQG